MRHMYMKDGHHAHYFAWSVAPDGTPNSNGPAPDGEEYFAMDLFLASRRWGDGEDIYEYSAWGREILRYCVHKGERYDGEPMWNPDNKLIKFIPETEWSDPSYHLPHFYEVFAEEADEEDRPFWHEAAAASRRYLQAACDERTGMNAVSYTHLCRFRQAGADPPSSRRTWLSPTRTTRLAACRCSIRMRAEHSPACPDADVYKRQVHSVPPRCEARRAYRW